MALGSAQKNQLKRQKNNQRIYFSPSASLARFRVSDAITRAFSAPFVSVASVSLLNGMAPKHIPDFYLILNEVKY